MRLLPALALLALAAGCDSSSPEPAPYGGVIEVSLAPETEGSATTALLLAAADDPGCLNSLAVETAALAERVDVRVVGIASGRRRISCQAVAPASRLVPLPFSGQTGTFAVNVTHAGATDAYTYSVGVGGERLEAVRTSTTRLATP